MPPDRRRTTIQRTAPSTAAGQAPRTRLRFARSRTDRILTGAAAGLADRLGVDHLVVRLVFVVLAAAGGMGVVLYVLAVLASRDVATEQSPAVPGSPELRLQKSVAVGLVVLGTLLVLRAVGLWFGDPVVWPIALGAFGSAVIWGRADDERRGRFASRFPGDVAEAMFAGPGGVVRIVLGGLLVATGMIAFLALNNTFAALRNVAFAVAVTIVGLVLILGPGMWRLGRQLVEERRERARQEERAEVAAHLHDSVLQSLAMIQRARTAEEMAGLARAQERELRAWLYGRADREPSGSLRAAIEGAAARVEDLHRVRVETVVVGDRPMDERLVALVQAAGEAMTNAARHAGVRELSLYVEVEPDRVTSFVRDRGKGFDPAAVPQDRRGIADSIRGRMDRAGGSASVESAVGQGTEVRLTVPIPSGIVP